MSTATDTALAPQFSLRLPAVLCHQAAEVARLHAIVSGPEEPWEPRDAAVVAATIGLEDTLSRYRAIVADPERLAGHQRLQAVIRQRGKALHAEAQP